MFLSGGDLRFDALATLTSCPFAALRLHVTNDYKTTPLKTNQTWNKPQIDGAFCSIELVGSRGD